MHGQGERGIDSGIVMGLGVGGIMMIFWQIIG
jgi:hypothetical protein